MCLSLTYWHIFHTTYLVQCILRNVGMKDNHLTLPFCCCIKMVNVKAFIYHLKHCTFTLKQGLQKLLYDKFKFQLYRGIKENEIDLKKK